MYHKVPVAKLSHPQILKLLRGHRIRVKHGSGHELHLSHEQAKKVMTAHKKGAGCCIQFDPYQIDHHQHLRGVKHAHHEHEHRGGALYPAGYNGKDYEDGEGSHKKIVKKGKGSHKKIGRKGKGTVDAIGAIYGALPQSAQNSIENGINRTFNIQNNQQKPTTTTKPPPPPTYMMESGRRPDISNYSQDMQQMILKMKAQLAKPNYFSKFKNTK